MTKKSFSINTFILTMILVISFLLMQNAIFLTGIAGSRSIVSASDVTDLTTDAINIDDSVTNFSNNTFANASSTSSFPRPPQSWSVWDENTLIEPEKAGIIDLTLSTWNSHHGDYGLTEFTRPPASSASSSDQYVLMINSGNNGSSDVRYNYGYANDTDVTLTSNSFYEISVRVYTDPTASASVYLTGEDVEETYESQITGINTQGGWQTVTFYIATGSEGDTSVGLELFLGEKSTIGGSAGFVLFDNVMVKRYSGDKFNEVLNTSTYSSFVDLRPTYLTSGDGFVENGDFSKPLSGTWTNETSSNGTVIYVNGSNATNSDFNKPLTVNDESIIFGTNQRGDNSGVVIAVNDGYDAIKSSDIEIKQHGLYRITFWAKGNLTTGSANFMVSGYLPEQTVMPDEDNPEGTLQSQSISTLSTSALAINNNWALYTFYIEGNPLFDGVVNLTLGLGTSSANATGYVAIAGIRSEKVTTAQLDATSSASSTATLTLNNFTTLSFVNGTFNFVEIGEDGVSYPLAPKDWTAVSDNVINSGVVNLLPELWSESNLNIARPAKPSGDYSDNVLMVRNDARYYQGYTSGSVNVAADGYALISVEAYTRSISSNGYAAITVRNADNVIIQQIRLPSTNAWESYEIYIKNTFDAQDLTVSLTLGDENTPTSGVAFFDNCIIDTSITEETFNGITADDFTYVVDLTTNSLTAVTNGQPTYWTGSIGKGYDPIYVNSGLIDVRYYDRYLEGNPTAPSDDNNMVLFIATTDTTNPMYYYYTSNLTYTFTSGQYYKLSVWVRTINIAKNVEGEYDENGNPYVNGASISIDGIDSSFTGINTAKNERTTLEDMFNDRTNEWTEYVMYINTTSDVDGVIRLGLGTQAMPTTGYVFFAGLTVTNLSEDDYNSETATIDTENLPDNILMATNTVEEEEETPNVYGSFDWFAIPTVIIAVAVIVAVVGFYIKKFYQNRPRKNATVVGTDYDRLQTLLKDVDRRERKTAIKHKIDLLHEELKQSQDFLAQEQAEYEKKVQAYNTAKEIAQDNPNVELELPDEKQIAKSIKIQQDKIEQIELDIRILEDEYDRINQKIKKETEKKEKTVQIKRRK